MTIIAKSTAFVAIFSLSLAFCTGDVLAETKNCPTMATASVNGERVILPAETAAQVTMLQQYGTRYERVIDLILAENAKPEWTFVEECSAEDAHVLALTE